MKKYNRFNFFKHTYCEWELKPFNVIDGKEPSYKSEKGSCYFFEEDGLYRYSNHWGRVANCRWKLVPNDAITPKVSQGYYVGYASWKSFFSNNENDPNYIIIVDFTTEEITFQHFMQSEDLTLCRRNAVDTAKRIAEIKKVFFADDWAKYLDCQDLESTRKILINELVNTNKKMVDIKRNLLK